MASIDIYLLFSEELRPDDYFYGRLLLEIVHNMYYSMKSRTILLKGNRMFYDQKICEMNKAIRTHSTYS